MRKVVLKMSVSIDGFVCGPNGEIDWMFRSRDARGKDWVAETVGRAGVHIVGRRTYQDWVTYWPYSTDILAEPMNRTPKVVFSRKGVVNPNALEAANRACDPEVVQSWTGARIASGDLQKEIQHLKEGPGNYICISSNQLTLAVARWPGYTSGCSSPVIVMGRLKLLGRQGWTEIGV